MTWGVPLLVSYHFSFSYCSWGLDARPFRYNLNQIRYDYTVEVRDRFKGLDWIDRVPDCTGDRDQDHPQEKEMQKGKMVV